MRISIPCLYSEYGRYINRFRAIPGNVDVLKPVERRLLLTLHQISKSKLTKCAKVVGAALAIHPHGDVSTYGTLVALVNRGFAEGKGNFGSQGYEEDFKAAAYRYTEIKASKYIEEMAFKYIKFVPWEVLELENEPLYLPCPVPLGLISAGKFSTITQGISFETTKIPRYTFSDLIKRLHEMLTNGKATTIIQPHCVGNNVAEDQPGEFENLLIIGTGQIWFCPNYEVKTNFMDIVDNRNPETGFNKLKKLHLTYPKTISVEDLSSKGKVRVRVHSKLGPVTTQFVTTIVKSISAKVSFKCNVVNKNGQVELHSIDDLLINSYHAWVESWMGNLDSKLEGQQSKLFRLQVIQIIRDNFKPNHTTINDIVIEFNKQKKLYNSQGIYENDVIEVASKGSIKQLVETAIDINSVQTEINNIKTSIKNLDTEAVKYIGGLL